MVENFVNKVGSNEGHLKNSLESEFSDVRFNYFSLVLSLVTCVNQDL